MLEVCSVDTEERTAETRLQSVRTISDAWLVFRCFKWYVYLLYNTGPFGSVNGLCLSNLSISLSVSVTIFLHQYQSPFLAATEFYADD